MYSIKDRWREGKAVDVEYRAGIALFIDTDMVITE